MKIPKSAQRDFKFLVEADLHGIGVGIGCETPMDNNGVSAMEAWFMLDTYGKRVPCREPHELDAAISGKASWNLQIKEWATDLADGLLLKMGELSEYTQGCPPWVFKATVNQAQRIALQTVGFIPNFLKTPNHEICSSIIKNTIPPG